jgi:hypothetical protein
VVDIRLERPTLCNLRRFLLVRATDGREPNATRMPSPRRCSHDVLRVAAATGKRAPGCAEVRRMSLPLRVRTAFSPIKGLPARPGPEKPARHGEDW